MTRACRLAQDLLLDAAERVPAKVAITAGDDAITYSALARRAQALAGALAAEGVARGDRVAIVADNGIAPVTAFWAALAAGAVPVVLHPQTRPARLAHVVADCTPRALIVEPRIERELAVRAPLVLAIGSPAWLAAVEAGPAPPRRCIDLDLASILYTSGSTGEPKGVMFAHRTVLAAHASIAEYLAIRNDDVILSALPLAFGYGLYQMIMAVAAGARLVLERSFAFPAEVLHRIAAERATGFPGVPTMFAAILRLCAGAGAGAAFDLSSLRYVTNAAAALAPAQVRALRELVPHAQIFSMYGQTECLRAAYLPPERLDAKPGSIGVAIPNTELWLEDEHGRRLGPGETGELVVRGAHVMQGYWNQPEATAAKLRPGPVPGERVLHTGDLCRLDADGDLAFVARTDDLIKSGGEKIAPRAIEDALLALPGVAEAAVVGAPDERLGEVARAFVVLAPGAALDAAAIHRACREHLEPHLVPRDVVVRDALPRSPNGKVQKSVLRQEDPCRS